MKKIIVAIIGSVKDILTLLSLRHVLIVAFFVTTFAYSLLLLPQSMLDALNIGGLRTNNLDKVGATAYTASFILIFGLLYQSVTWIYSKLSRKAKENQEKRQTWDIFDDLSRGELVYLIQFVRNRTTRIKFGETDPVVALLREKRIIYPFRGRVRRGYIHSYNCTYMTGQACEISATTYDYLTKHPELFDRLLSLKPQFHPLFARLHFLDSVEDNSAIEDLKSKVSRLVDFIESLEMGAIYAKRIEDLICQPDDAHLMQSNISMSEREYLLARDKLAQKYREQLQDVRDQVYLLATELLHLQPW